MILERKDINYDPQTDKLATWITIKLIDGNGMMLKAKAELYASIMEGLDTLVNAKIAEFAERYGDEVIKFAHNNIVDDLRDTEPSIKVVNPRETAKKLLNKAFEVNTPNP